MILRRGDRSRLGLRILRAMKRMLFGNGGAFIHTGCAL